MGGSKILTCPCPEFKVGKAEGADLLIMQSYWGRKGLGDSSLGSSTGNTQRVNISKGPVSMV